MRSKLGRWVLAVAVLSIPVVVFAAENAQQADSSCSTCHKQSCHR